MACAAMAAVDVSAAVGAGTGVVAGRGYQRDPSAGPSCGLCVVWHPGLLDERGSPYDGQVSTVNEFVK